jgi:hypothetical protein
VRPFGLSLHYGYAHVYYLLSWVTRREYFVACDICHRGAKITRKEAEALSPADPVPTLRRSGWKIGLGVVGALVAFAAILPMITANAQRPHVGDVYECMFDAQEGDAKDRYGLVLVQAISENQVALVPSKAAYSDRKSAHEAFTTKQWRDPAFLDAAHSFNISPEQLQRFLSSGRVFNIWREN